MARSASDLTPVDVDREVVLLMTVTDETASSNFKVQLGLSQQGRVCVCVWYSYNVDACMICKAWVYCQRLCLHALILHHTQFACTSVCTSGQPPEGGPHGCV